MKNIFVLIALACTACDEKPETNDSDYESIVEDIYHEDGEVIVSISPNPNAYMLTCDSVVSIYETPGDESSLLLKSAHSVGNRWEGYYLDGEFVYPDYGMGCDIMECVPLEGPFSEKLITYELEDERLEPPEGIADYLDEDEIPEDVGSVSTREIVRGMVEVQVKYYQDSSCTTIEIETFERFIE